MALPIEVLADLSLAVDGEEIDVRGEGDLVIVDLPSLRAGRQIVSSGPFFSGERDVSRLHAALWEAGLTVDVRLRGDTVARLGVGAQPSAVARLLKLGKVEVRPAQPLVSAARRRPLLVLGFVAGVTALLTWLAFRSRGE